MTVLCDWEIASLCEASQLVWPFRPELINPASIDVTLGTELLVEVSDQKDLIRVDISKYTEDDPYMLMPKEFVLAHTMESFNIPAGLSAQFVLKSSRAREGFTNALAGWADPGWHGSKLTLELNNIRRHWSLPLYPNMKIGQMIFFHMSSTPLHDYSVTGRYNNHATVMGSADEKTT